MDRQPRLRHSLIVLALGLVPASLLLGSVPGWGGPTGTLSSSPSVPASPPETHTPTVEETPIRIAPALPDLDTGAAALEAASLRQTLRKEVPQASLIIPPQDARRWIGLTAQALAQASVTLERAQLLIVIDRAPRVQSLLLVLASRKEPASWLILGRAHVSTGQPGRKDHYLTPTGVFPHTSGILDYRAQGTFNENHIRGLGVKGMRVWDFGWQTARKGWRADGETGPIRLLMHATDPAVLESRIGRQASQGCVRLPAALNVFLDRHGVLDAEYEQTAAYDIGYRALLRPDRTPTPLAGKYMVVIDSSGEPL